MEKRQTMRFKRERKIVKQKIVAGMLVIICIIAINRIWGIGIHRESGQLQRESMDAKNIYDDRSIGADNLENNKELKAQEKNKAKMKLQISRVPKTESDLNVLLAEIHKAYIFSQWFMRDTYGIPNSYAEDRIAFKPEDLESVIFYENDEGKLFFIPVNMVNKTVCLEDREIKVCEYHDGDRINLYLYSYEVIEREMERAIYPEPDKVVYIYPEEVQEYLSQLQVLGIAHVPFPKEVPDGASKLYENEYTDEVVDIIHSFFYDRKMYGEYQIYLGDFLYRPDWDEGYKISITVAIVGKETSYWWIFRAKDVLAEDGRVILDSDGGQQHTYPAEYDKATYNYYAPEIDGIIHANRLVIPLTVQEGDIVKRLGVFKDEDDINTLHYYLE